MWPISASEDKIKAGMCATAELWNYNQLSITKYNLLTKPFISFSMTPWCPLWFTTLWCAGQGSARTDRKRHPLDAIEEVADRRMLVKLTPIMDNTSQPLHRTVMALRSSVSARLRHPQCKKEDYRKSFILSATRLFNSTR